MLYITVISRLCFVVADVLWIASTLFAAVYSSFEEGDTPKFQLISTPVSCLTLDVKSIIIYGIINTIKPLHIFIVPELRFVS